jgi:cellulose synthase/poly-beta-1,6-N-acetylglucosamine synthase-like glycosyltransferase
MQLSQTSQVGRTAGWGRVRQARAGVGDGRALVSAPATGSKVVVLVPAHNEEHCIAGTLRSLDEQTRRPDRVLVVADNCTDGTARVAAEFGAEVFTTAGNSYKKAGALNQALDRVLPTLGDGDAVLVMDADSELDGTWVELAESHLHRGHSACGGIFTGRAGKGLVSMFQRNEYARYQRDVRRRNGKTLVLTGTATLFRASVLNEVIEARRSGKLPGEPHVYDVKVLTEDNELTLALLHLGHKIIAPAECHLTTEVMETWGDLHRQRLRWKRGALENLFDYGLTRYTAKYWGRQLLSATGLFVTFAYLSTLVGTFVATGTVHLHPVWMAVTAIFSLEQAITVRDRGWPMSMLAAVLIVEMPYDFFLQATHARALWDALRKSEGRW